MATPQPHTAASTSQPMAKSFPLQKLPTEIISALYPYILSNFAEEVHRSTNNTSTHSAELTCRPRGWKGLSEEGCLALIRPCPFEKAMEAVFWIWQDYRKYRIRNSMFVTMFWGLINEMGQFNDFTRDAFSLVVNLRTDLPPMMTQNIRQLLFRKESWKCRTSEAIGDEFGFVFDNLLDGIYPSSPNLSISSPLLPELRTIYISGFEHGEPHSRVARYNQFRDANVANRYHTLDKVNMYTTLYRLLFLAGRAPGNKISRLGLSHSPDCGSVFRCFWEDFEMLIRPFTKRLSYIDDSFLDTHEEYMYIHEFAESDGTGSTLNWDVLMAWRKDALLARNG